MSYHICCTENERKALNVLVYDQARLTEHVDEPTYELKTEYIFLAYVQYNGFLKEMYGVLYGRVLHRN